ncbi:LADA_0B05622g1_1 [Lachancea dasiensis]|uniref:LADA_0B05622g1_1 n=1 Tax=Lachancea dasiensis TaxID=1072105 RepID=A0A1G4ITB5_9SACH|nr:LADA_0B05622g1_1 [Lachancea dasiensis]
MITSRNFGMVCYVLTYVRYIKDNSLLNVVLSVLVIILSQVLQQMVTLYYKKRQDSTELGSNPSEELATIFRVLMKGLRYYQTVFVLQFVLSLLYHLKIDIDRDVCAWKNGYIFVDLVGEFDCGQGGKWMIFMLDIFLLLSQLLTFSECFNTCGRTVGETVRETSLEGFNSHDFGILSILRFDSLGTQAHELGFISEGRTLGSPPDDSYGSIIQSRDLEVLGRVP